MPGRSARASAVSGLGFNQRILQTWSLQNQPESPSYMSKKFRASLEHGAIESESSARTRAWDKLSFRRGTWGLLCSDTNSRRKYETSKIVDALPCHAPSRWHGEILGLPLVIHPQLSSAPHQPVIFLGFPAAAVWLYVCLSSTSCLFAWCVQVYPDYRLPTHGWVYCKGM